MDNMGEGRIRALLLFSLARKRKWGESHTAIENLFKIFKSEGLGREGLRRAKEIWDELVREGFILKKPAHYGLQVSLNPRMAREIKELVRKELKFEV